MILIGSVGVKVEGIQYFSENNIWVTGGNAILHTLDGGTHWSIQNFTYEENFNDIYFIDENRGWIAEGHYYSGSLHRVDGNHESTPSTTISSSR